MNYAESDLPVTLQEAEMLTLADGSVVRFETNAEAKDIMINDSWTPAVTLFPGCEYTLESGGQQYKIVAQMEAAVEVSKL
ncbi:MAG: hypothetical protein AB7D07_01475 [Desulfovibrionaceae bacterium]